jgi:aspartyl-tRNA(Asn)/glutamyl-tRNA(Gln) amidotransferase subunit A
MSHRLRTLSEASVDLRAGRVTAAQLVDECLAQIEKLEPKIKAWVSVDAAGAQKLARDLDAEAAAGRYRGPLHGLPIGIKDIVDMAGLPTLAGSPLRKGHIAEADAPIVTKLRAAGAILIGKTVTTEFASFDPPPTRNPWNFERTPAGSSSGSAAAVATGMCLAAIGSQTGGSIVRPAAYCGVAGIKPTYGRVSLAGIFPLACHLDHPGPIARSVADLAIVLGVIAGHDPADPISSRQPVADYASELKPGFVPRFGLLRDYFLEKCTAEVREATLATVERLRAAGATVRDVPLPAGFERVPELHHRIMAVEAAFIHRGTFPSQRDKFSPQISKLLDRGNGMPIFDYVEAIEHQKRYIRTVQQSLDGIEALIMPSTTTTAGGLETTGDPAFNSCWSYAGLPSVTIPCAVCPDGMPSGLQLVGPAFGESSLLAAAAWCEQAIAFDRLPACVAG